jgi:hypothetical protein
MEEPVVVFSSWGHLLTFINWRVSHGGGASYPSICVVAKVEHLVFMCCPVVPVSWQWQMHAHKYMGARQMGGLTRIVTSI